MAMTTGGDSFRKADVDISADGVAWTVVSDHGAAVAVSDAVRSVGEQHVFSGDVPIIRPGKRAKLEVTVRFVYTETAAEPFEVVRAIFETEGGEAWVRWFPLDNTDGNYVFETGQGIMTKFTYPQGEADGEDVILCECTVTCSQVTKDAAVGGS